MNREEIAGKTEAFKGKAKQTIGRITNDPDLEDEGVVDEEEGKARDNIGRARRKVGEAIEQVGKRVKK